MLDSTDPLLWILLTVILVLISTLQAACYTAISRISDSDLERAEDGSVLIEEPARSRIIRMREKPNEHLRSVWFWQILASSMGSISLTLVWDVNPFLIAILFTAVVYLAGASLPVIFARKHDVRFAIAFSGPSRFFTTLSTPFTAILSFISRLIAKAAGVDASSLENEVTEDEILSMVNEGHEQGAIDKDEAEMISNIFELDDKEAHDIMIHRGDIDAFDAETTLDEALNYMIGARNSRFPVYEGSIDNIIGILYLRDAMAFHMKGQFNQDSLNKIPHLLREVTFIPETVDLDDLFRQMQQNRNQMVIVVDEYGQTSGLLTMEDILEEIVGNILDEYDKEEKLIARVGDGHLRMNGKALLEDVEKALHTTIESEDYDTLSGYLTEKIGHIPTNDDRGREIKDDALGYCFRILSVNGTMIGWLDVSAIPESSDTTDQKT